MAGGGGSGGGAVVGGPSPMGAILAGQYQASAANAAARQAESAINDAITALNRQYQQARYDVQPYRTEGVQALNQLNQYMGLDPYNPGVAPTAPQANTLENALGKISDDAIAGYIQEHLQYFPKISNGKAQQGTGRINYTGAYRKDDQQYATGSQWTSAPDTFYNPAGFLFTQDQIREGARYSLADQYMRENQDAYDVAQQAYQRDLQEYNQNLDMYNQYSQEGPLTAAQITDRIANLPGYQAELNQGVDAIQKAASARGGLGSGRLLKELSQYGQNTMGRYYQNELDRLSQLAGAGQQAATFSGQSALGTGQGQAGLYSNLGDIKANSALASGNALAQAILAANQQYKIIGGDSGGGGLGGIGGLLGGVGSIMSAISPTGFSSKTLKNKVSTPSVDEILESVKALDIDVWQYKGIDRNHLGPYAEDIKEKFGVGTGKTINMIDMMGIMLASIKALANEVEELKRNK